MTLLDPNPGGRAVTAAWRPPEAFLHGDIVIVPRRACAWLEQFADLRNRRTAHRGVDAEVDAVLVAIATAAAAWRQAHRVPTVGTNVAGSAEPAASSLLLTSTQAAELLGCTDRAVRKAAAEGRLLATKSGRCWRIEPEALAHYRAANAA